MLFVIDRIQVASEKKAVQNKVTPKSMHDYFNNITEHNFTTNSFWILHFHLDRYQVLLARSKKFSKILQYDSYAGNFSSLPF
jgi:hypothetical protein